ncbi:MAG: hypothetical protein ABL973_05105 [Micropepsaceae bacterium]
MSGWDRVVSELDLWAREERTARFWWRDDDATDVSRNLVRMVRVAADHRVAIGLSVIPLRLSSKLRQFIAEHRNLDVLVHGLAHQSHARGGQAKREFGGQRSLGEMTDDLKKALALSRSAFGKRCLPVLVPPWNRIPPRVVRALPKFGYEGLSTWKPRAEQTPVPGLLQVNTHLDVINWRAGRTIKPEALVASLLLRKLRWRRADPKRALEPLGLLTHHEYWCAEKEAIILNLLRTTREHPAVRWLTARQVFEKQ